MSFPCDLDDSGAISDINMTPLVDVMLVLLIIFIITVPVLTQTVHVDLPDTTGTPDPALPTVIVVSIAADGSYAWDAQSVDVDALPTRLAQLAAEQPEAAVHLHGDRQVAYERVMRVMAAAQAAGIARLGFVTEPLR